MSPTLYLERDLMIALSCYGEIVEMNVVGGGITCPGISNHLIYPKLQVPIVQQQLISNINFPRPHPLDFAMPRKYGD